MNFDCVEFEASSFVRLDEFLHRPVVRVSDAVNFPFILRGHDDHGLDFYHQTVNRDMNRKSALILRLLWLGLNRLAHEFFEHTAGRYFLLVTEVLEPTPKIAVKVQRLR